METSQLIALGLQYHRSGDFAQAEFAYRQVLEVEPSNADVWCVLGMVQRAQGRLDEAIASQQQALQIRPQFVEALVNLGNVFTVLDQPERAVPLYRQALEYQPDHTEAHMNLGVALRAQDQLDEALGCYRRAIELSPGHAQTQANLADVLVALNRADEAVAACHQALRLAPDLPAGHMTLGAALTRLGRTGEAFPHLRRALELKPDYFEAHVNLGNAFMAERRFAEARAEYARAAHLRPASSHVQSSLALAEAELGHAESAQTSYQAALAARPTSVDTLLNLGNVCAGLQRWDEAIEHYRHALKIEPQRFDTLKNLAVTLMDQCKLAESQQVMRQMLALEPENAEAHFLLGTCYLLGGDFEHGWPEYEWRWRMPEFGGLPNLAGIPRWQGEPLAGRGVLLFPEQGLGDTLQFVRYARPLRALGARVQLLCPASLTSLLARQPDIEQLFAFGGQMPRSAADYYLPLLSAPHLFKTTELTIPRAVPYLSADPDLVDEWGRELAGFAGLNVGIAWQGSRDFRQDRWRSIPLSQFAPLAQVPGVRLVSLQKGFGTEQMAAVDFPLVDWTDRLDATAGPFMDTAAILANLDLVVTSDSAVAHLAGGLGVPVWLAAPVSPNWRWLLARSDSPWYPTMRVFRQTATGDWPGVFERMATELAKLAAKLGKSD